VKFAIEMLRSYNTALDIADVISELYVGCNSIVT